jgi:hypothetical protein
VRGGRNGAIPLDLLDGSTATFRFDRPSDGECETPDGGRPDLLRLLEAVPDRSLITVCVTGEIAGRVFEGCAGAKFRNFPSPRPTTRVPALVDR